MEKKSRVMFCIRCSTIETKEAVVLDITGFFFRMSTYSDEG